MYASGMRTKSVMIMNVQGVPDVYPECSWHCHLPAWQLLHASVSSLQSRQRVLRAPVSMECLTLTQRQLVTLHLFLPGAVTVTAVEFVCL